MKKATLAALVVGLVFSAASAGKADDANARSTRMAYDIAMKCFVANGVARGNNRDLGKTAEAAKYEANARQSFNAASNLGDKLGYSGTRINQDFGMAQADQLPKLVKDAAYLERTLAMCGSAGL